LAALAAVCSQSAGETPTPLAKIAMVRRLLPLLVVLVLGTACEQPDGRKSVLHPTAGQQIEEQLDQPSFQDISLRAQNARTPVIMYHDVIERRDRKSEWFDVTRDEFEQQMKTVADAGGKTLTLDEFYKHLTEGTPVPLHSIVLTFDDNYQGVADIAVPILKKYGFTASVFVHTGFVGNKTQGRPKMDWDTLAQLTKEGTIQVEDHTITHPADITKLSEDEQRKELADSKSELEDKLKIKVDYLAYPDGANDAVTRRLAQECGYKMAFTMHGDAAEVSPDILRINRWEQTKFQDAWKACELENQNAPLGLSTVDLATSQVTFKQDKFDGVELVYVLGGKPASILSDTRQSVGEFVRSTQGAVAGINGTFFNMAAITATDNGLIGPSRESNKGVFTPDNQLDRLPKLRNRPVIFWNAKQAMIAPFALDRMNTEDPYRAVMPDYTDLFLSGAWIVKDGLPRTAEQMQPYASSDIQDPRRRAFFGFTAEGLVIAGASKGSVTTEQLARAAQQAGAVQAILLDSGFSTSLIFDDKVLASGHSDPENPSRPVPHAIVLIGEKDPTVDTSALIEDNGAQGQGGVEPNRRRRRHRHRSSADPAASPDAAPPVDSNPSTPPPNENP